MWRLGSATNALSITITTTLQFYSYCDSTVLLTATLAIALNPVIVVVIVIRDSVG